MLKLFAKVLSALLLGTLLNAPAAADAIKAVKITPDSNPFGGPTIEVESNGDEWTRIVQRSHELKVKVDIRAGSGWRVKTAYIGVPNADLAGTSGQTDAVRSLGGGRKVKSITRTETHTFHTDDLVFDRASIINLCNSGDHPATQEHTEFTTVSVGIKAYFLTRREAKELQEGSADDRGRSETRYAQAPVTVRCLAGPSRVKAPPEPFQVDVRVEQHGETCPKRTDVRAILKYRVPTTARFRFKVDGKLSKVHEIKARKIAGPKPGVPASPGNGAYYLVERLKTYHLDPGNHNFRIEVQGGKGKKSAVKTVNITCPPFKILLTTLNYKVPQILSCPKRIEETTKAIGTRPGKARLIIKSAQGLVVHSGIADFKRKGMQYVAKVKRHNLMMGEYDSEMMADFPDYPANSGWMPLKVPCGEVMSGTLELRKFKATRCESEAAFSIRTTGPGKVPYSLDCTNGKSWTGKLDAVETGPNTYIGVGVKRFGVKNNELVRCALKTRNPLPFKILAGAKETFECHKPTGVSGSDDLVSDTRPEEPPGVGLKLKGDFSFIDRGAPKCERTGKALINFSMNQEKDIGYSLDCNIGHFSGVAKAIPNGKGGYIAPALVSFDIEKTTRVACALKSVSPGPTKIQALKGEMFPCHKPTFDPVTTDLTAEPNPTHDNPNPTVVVDPPREVSPGTGPNVIVDPVRVICLRGAVRNDKCYCPPKHKKTQTGKNRWRCDRAVIDPPKTPPGAGPNVIIDPVRIVCLRGAVRNNGCYCPPKHKKTRSGANKWRCDRVVVDPPKTPPGSGPNMIADPPRRISCRNGTVRNNTCFCSKDRIKKRVGRNAWSCVKRARVDPPKKGGSAVNSGRPKIKTAPLVRTKPKKKKKKKKKSKKRRTSSNGGAMQMRMNRRR